MAMNCAYEDVGTTKPMTAQETVALLADAGFKPVHLISKEAAEALCGAYGSQLLPAARIRVLCNCVPAILSVQGSGELHAVFWTGKEVIDPAPGREKPRSWEQYDVLEAVIIH